MNGLVAGLKSGPFLLEGWGGMGAPRVGRQQLISWSESLVSGFSLSNLGQLYSGPQSPMSPALVRDQSPPL